jgi:alkylation response protein AidB-like acyl-CoA dehydrogenase
VDLSYGPEYEAFRGEVRAFLEAHWPPSGDDDAAPRAERERRFRRLATERGYLNRHIPRRYGGSEQPPDALRAQIIREEFGRARAPVEVGGNGMMMLVPTLLERGEEWQRQRFIPKTVTGEYLWAQGYSEPGAGSDLASLRTRAELVGDHWVIHGQKIWTSYAPRCEYMFALVRTEPQAPRHAGLSYLLVPMRQAGIEIRPLRQITGESQFSQVFFDGARTPADWIVGKRGEGWSVSRTTLRHERNAIGSSTRSLDLFDSLLRLAGRARRDGRPALEDPQLRDRLAALLGYVRAQQYSGYVMLTREARGEDPGILTLLSKLQFSQISKEVTQIALSLLGDAALLAPSPPGARSEPKASEGSASPPGARSEPWMFQFMGSLGLSIAGGTSNIQRNIIAERGLGLPRDPLTRRTEDPA